jgi:hypothetical protein
MSVFDNGGFVGRIADYTDTSQYVITPESSELATLTYVGGRTQSGAGTTANISVSLTSLTGGTDTGPLAGDMVIIAIEMCGTTNKSYRIANYVQIADLYANDTEDSNLQVGYKFMGATPDTTAIITGGSGSNSDAFAIVVQVWRNVDSTTPMDVTPTTASLLNTGIPNPPAITPITSGAQIIVAAGTAHTGGVDTFGASYLSNFRTVGANDNNDATVGMGNIAWTSGSYDPAAWTFTQANSTAFSTNSVTFALRPATTVVEGVLGNQKNSGIWSLQTVWANSTGEGGGGASVVGVFNSTTSSQDYSGTLTDLQVGDVLFFTAAASFGLYDYDGGPNDPRPAPVRDDGYTTIIAVDSGLSYYICYKVLTSENILDTSVYTGNNQAYFQIVQVRGLELTQFDSFSDGFQNRLLDTSIRTTSSGTTAVDPPSITAGSGNFMLCINIVGGTLTMTAPTNYTLASSFSYDNGRARSISSGYRSGVSAGTEDPGSFSSNPTSIYNERWTFALATL